MRTPHLNPLRALEATLRLGSFRAATGELGVTPAAVGHQVRTLDRRLGRPLLDRAATGVRPTEEADALAPRLTQGFARLTKVF
jgi:Transcriptional regulator